MRKLNNYIKLGIILFCIFQVSNCFNLFPEFLKGLCVGLGIALILLGAYSENHNIARLKNYKKRVFNKCIEK